MMLSTFSCDYWPSVYPLWRNSYSKPFAIVQLLNHVWLFATPWTHQASLSFTISWSLLKLMSIESVMPFQPSHPLLSPSPPAFSLSQHQSFLMSQLFRSSGQSTGASASASVLPMNIQDWFPLELTGLISLAVQRTLKSLLQHHSSKASILWGSAFFMINLYSILKTELFAFILLDYLASLYIWKWNWKPLGHVRLFATPWTV